MIHNINIHAVGMEENCLFSSFHLTFLPQPSFLQIYDVGSGGK